MKRLWPFFLFVFLIFIFFWKFFIKGLLPIPADIIVGMYFPWLNYKWGYLVGVPIKNPLISDVVSQIYIWKGYLSHSFQGLKFLLWDDSILTGTPLLASFQASAFYPFNIFYLLFSKEMAFSLLVIFQAILSLIFSFLYLREIKASKLASIFGSVIFSFSAFAVVWSQWATIVHAGLYLPLLLLLIERYFSQQKNIFLGLISLFFAFSVFAGHSQITLYLVFFSFIYILFKYFILKNGKEKLGIIFSLFFSFVLGLLISAIQIIPSLELFLCSFREKEHYVEQANFGLVSIQNVLTFFAPDFFGNPTTRNYWGIWNYQETALYLGILPLFFIFLLIFRKKDKLTTFYLTSFLIVSFLIFDSPLGKLIYWLKIPILSNSYASRGIYLLTFTASVLAALGFDFFLKEKLKRKELTSLTIIVFFLTFLFFYLRSNPTFLVNSFIKTDIQNASVAIRNLILPILIIFVSWAFLLWSNFLKDKTRKWFAVIFILILFLDLFRFADKYLPFVKKEMVFPKTPILDYLQQQKKPFRIESESDDILPANMWSFYRIESASGYNPLYSARYAEFISILNSNETRSNVSRYGLIGNFDSPLFDLLNIKYMLALKRDENGRVSDKGEISYLFRDSKFKEIYSDKSLVVLENTSSFPRAFLVEDIIIEKDEKKITNLMTSSSLDFSQTVILEEEVSGLEQIDLDQDFSESVEYMEYSPTEKILRIKTNIDKILFISEAFYPGWKAFLDDKETKIYRANYAFRAILVPKGDHHLRIVYDPMSLKVGSFLSLAGILICASLFLRKKQ